MKELLDRDIGASAPIFGHQRYDLISDLDGDLERVQVKTAFEHHEQSDCVVMEFSSMVDQSDGTAKKTYYSKDEIDSYIAYCPEQNVLLYVTFEETPKTAMIFSLRDRDDYNPINRKRVNFAEDYLLDARL